MRPSLTVRIKNAVAVDDLVIFVFKQGKIEFSGESLFQLLDKHFRLVMSVNTDRQDLDLFLLFFGQKALQLPELLRAVGSPVTAVKNQDYILLALEVGEGNSLPIHVLQSEVGRLISGLNPFQVSGY